MTCFYHTSVPKKEFLFGNLKRNTCVKSCSFVCCVHFLTIKIVFKIEQQIIIFDFICLLLNMSISGICTVIENCIVSEFHNVSTKVTNLVKGCVSYLANINTCPRPTCVVLPHFHHSRCTYCSLLCILPHFHHSRCA